MNNITGSGQPRRIFDVARNIDFINDMHDVTNDGHNSQNISNFVDAVHREQENRDGSRVIDEEEIRDQESLQQAKKVADEMIINAEQFKAVIVPKTGKDLLLPRTSEPNQQQEVDQVGVIIDSLKKQMVYDTDCDDEFFHIMCHIDPALRMKIEKGDFVDLERLLPKNRSQMFKEDNAMQFYYNEGGEPYWAPARKETCISNVHKWEQAFQVYAAIYSDANPLRASEIWLYVCIINHAASAYTWENISFYDITFRHFLPLNA